MRKAGWALFIAGWAAVLAAGLLLVWPRPVQIDLDEWNRNRPPGAPRFVLLGGGWSCSALDSVRTGKDSGDICEISGPGIGEPVAVATLGIAVVVVGFVFIQRTRPRPSTYG